MGFSRQEHWSGLPCPPPGDLPDPGTEPTSLTSPVSAGGDPGTEPTSLTSPVSAGGFFTTSTSCTRACVHAKSLQSCPTLVTLWTLACQAPLSVGFSRQEHWSGLPCPPPGDLPNPAVKPTSLNVSCVGRRVLDYWCRLCGWSRVCTRGEVLQRPPKGSRQPLVGPGKLVGRAGRRQGGEGRLQQVSSWAGKNTQGLTAALTSNTGSYLLAQEQSRRQAKEKQNTVSTGPTR